MCISAIVLLMTVGCNRTDTPAATQPATHPATMPANATLVVDGRAMVFEKPRAAIDRRGVTARLVLYSDGEGNAFYFIMPLDGQNVPADPEEWQERKDKRQREETVVGIELPDLTLQPVELSITASRGDGMHVHVKLRGRFQVYQGDSDDPSGEAAVEGEFDAGMAP